MDVFQSVNKLRAQGRLPQAMRLLGDSVPNRAYQARALAVLAEIQLYYQKPEKSLELADLALKADCDTPAILFIQALASHAAEDVSGAKKSAELLLQIQPQHEGAKDFLLALEGHTVRPEAEEKIRRLREKKSPLSIAIHSPSDKEHNPDMRPLWGDYWVKEELTSEFKNMGLVVSDADPDIILHLFGFPPKTLSKKTYNIAWIYSHPDLVTSENLRQFDKITCAAVSFIPKLDVFGYLNRETMPACSSKKPLTVKPVHDMIFLGNARKSRPDGRGVVADMRASGLDFKVWGNLWEQFLPSKYYGGHYWAYEKLDELYASARITLNDHHPDMTREGFVSNKVFDILASGGFVISQANAGLVSIFGGSVPQYETPEQLRTLACYFLENPSKREAIRLQGQKTALKYTYRKCVKQFLNGLLG